MSTRVTDEELIAALREVEYGDDGSAKHGVTCWHRNPDGPAAADRINSLNRAMRFAATKYALEMFPVYQDVLADMTVGRRKRELLACGSVPQDVVRAA